MVETGRGFMFGHVSSGHILPGNGFRRVQRRTTEGGVFSYFKTLHTFLVETLLSVMPLYSDSKSCITKLTAVVVSSIANFRRSNNMAQELCEARHNSGLQSFYKGLWQFIMEHPWNLNKYYFRTC